MATDLNLLMEYMIKGDENAFEIIYNETKDRVFYTVLAILRDYPLAEDIMQDTFIKVRQNVSSYRAGSNPIGWIITIARNLALNEYKKRTRETPVDTDQSDYLFKDYTIDNSSTYAVQSMLKVLDVREREIVILHTISGFKHKEIARIMNTPLGTVLWLYNRAMKKLRIELSKEEG